MAACCKGNDNKQVAGENDKKTTAAPENIDTDDAGEVEDDIPELFVFDSPDTGVRLCAYDEASDKVVEIGSYGSDMPSYFSYYHCCNCYLFTR